MTITDNLKTMKLQSKFCYHFWQFILSIFFTFNSNNFVPESINKKKLKKRIIYTLLIIIFCTPVNSQNIDVTSFKMLPNDNSARLDAVKKDPNGYKCAIIKIMTTETGFKWESDAEGIIAAEYKTGEYWLYVPYGAKRLTIKHDILGVLRDYMYTLPIEKATVYEMVIATGRVKTTVIKEILENYLLIVPEPANARIFINNQFVKTGEYYEKLKPGFYDYRVESLLYHTEAGRIEMKNKKIEIKIKLKPAHGFLQVNTFPEDKAVIEISRTSINQLSPYMSDKMASGEYDVKIFKDMYELSNHKVIINDNETTTLNVNMAPKFAELTINAPSGARIMINKEYKGTGKWSGRLNPAIYSISSSLESHKDAYKEIELNKGDNKTIELTPTPIYGSLDVTTSPSGAQLYIAGKNYGKTPLIVKELLIGSYNITLSKQGFQEIKRTIVIKEDENNELKESLIASTVYSATKEDSVKRKLDSQYLTDLHSKFNKYKTEQKSSARIAVISAGLGVGCIYLIKDTNKELDNWSGTQEKLKEIKDQRKAMYLVTVMSFASATFFSIDFIIQNSKKREIKKLIKLSAIPVPKGAGLMLTMNF